MLGWPDDRAADIAYIPDGRYGRGLVEPDTPECGWIADLAELVGLGTGHDEGHPVFAGSVRVSFDLRLERKLSDMGRLTCGTWAG